MHTIHAAIKVSLLSYDTDGNHRTDDIVNTLVLATPFYFFNKDKTKMRKCQGKNNILNLAELFLQHLFILFDKKTEINQKFLCKSSVSLNWYILIFMKGVNGCVFGSYRLYY